MPKLNSKLHLLTTPLFIVLLNTPCVSSANGGTLQFSQPTFNVCDSGEPTVVVIEVTREGGSDGKVSVKYATTAGTATVDSDYKEKTGELVWENGDATAKTFEVEIIGDHDLNEGYETVSLTLAEPTGDASLGTPSESTLGIADTCLKFSQPMFTIHENDKPPEKDKPRVAKIEVTREGGNDGKVSVKYSTADDTATAGSDYKKKTGELVWEDGDATAKTFEVEIINDREFNEGYETVSLELTEPTDAALGTPSKSTLKIADDDCGTNKSNVPPPLDWVSRCPSGTDQGLATKGQFELKEGGCPGGPLLGKLQFTGPTTIFRGEPSGGSIQTELASLLLKGDGFVIQAGDGTGNLLADGPRYSPGLIQQNSDGTATSTFDIRFEITNDGKIKTFKWHNKEPCQMKATINRIPPIFKDKNPKANAYECDQINVYNESNQAAACLIHAKHLPVTFTKPFTATKLADHSIQLTWETGMEKDLAGFAVYRGELKDQEGECTDNADDYATLTMIAWEDSQGGLEGTSYSVMDSSGKDQGCYGLVATEFDGTSEVQVTKISN